MLEVGGLYKRFGGFTAVSNVSFKVEKGEILGQAGERDLTDLLALVALGLVTERLVGPLDALSPVDLLHPAAEGDGGKDGDEDL